MAVCFAGCEDDVKVVKWLAFDHHVAVIPGSGESLYSSAV